MAKIMNGGEGGMMGGPMMGAGPGDEEELYRSTETENEAPSIPKDLLPPEVKVGMHLEITEDLGDSVRVKIADMSQPSPGGKAPDEEAALY